MHLKNFSLITRAQITTLAPAYDLLNSSIALSSAKEELALPLKRYLELFTLRCQRLEFVID